MNLVLTNPKCTSNFEYNKGKHFTPVENKTYAITVSINPNIYSQSSPVKQFRASKDAVFLRMAQSGVKSCVLYAELTKIGNIHYHGNITFEDMVLWTTKLKRFVETIGNILIKPIEEEDIWFDYCTKEKFLMDKVLGEESPYTLYKFKADHQVAITAKLKERRRLGNIERYLKSIPKDSASDSE